MKIKDFSYLNVQGFMAQFMEIRIDYGAGTVPLYVGYNHTPNADTAVDTWFIVKLIYSGSNLVRQELPNTGVQFNLVWDNRSTYFS